MTLDEYMTGRAPKGPWRRRAFSAISAVVESIAAVTGNVLDDPADLLARVDAAYPFGERKYAPYKAWLAERRRFRSAIDNSAIDNHAVPSPDEIAACEVARDAVLEERGGDVVQLLLAQAPNRHARKCAVCGASPGKPCTELVPADQPAIREGNPYDNVNRALASQSHHSRPLVVPHQARLVGHRGAGPLFGGQP